MDFLVPKINGVKVNRYEHSIYVYKSSKKDGESLKNELKKKGLRVIGNMHGQLAPESMMDGDVYYYSILRALEIHIKRCADLLSKASVIVLPYTISPGQLLMSKNIKDNFMLYSIESEDFKDDMMEMKKSVKDIIFKNNVLKFPGLENKIDEAKRIDKQFNPIFRSGCEPIELKSVGSSSGSERSYKEEIDEWSLDDIIAKRSGNVESENQIIPLPCDDEVLIDTELKVIEESSREYRINGSRSSVEDAPYENFHKHRTGQFILDVMIDKMCPLRDDATGRIMSWQDEARYDEYVPFDEMGHLTLKASLEIAFKDCPNSIVIQWLLDKRSSMKSKIVKSSHSVLLQPAWMTFNRWFNNNSGFVLLSEEGHKMLKHNDIVDYTKIIPSMEIDMLTFLLYFFDGANLCDMIHSFLP